ncbi:MAG: hypothetical protein CFE24_09145 [Flavobacterium sp. BFFFF2]|nr:MAG: hypothetical protein CFE24_09145 [Flavobacterium sp. BFFFF2]
MIYNIRAILDTEEDVFRDIAIRDTDTLEDLHQSLINAFGFDGMEMASFYTCDDRWNQEDEIPLFDTGDEPGQVQTMNDYSLLELLHEDHTKIIYVYDFLNMWTFLVELASITEEQVGVVYPELMHAHGVLPESAPNAQFESDGTENNPYADFEDDYDEDDFDQEDEFGGEHYEDLGFEDNWN